MPVMSPTKHNSQIAKSKELAGDSEDILPDTVSLISGNHHDGDEYEPLETVGLISGNDGEANGSENTASKSEDETSKQDEDGERTRTPSSPNKG